MIPMTSHVLLDFLIMVKVNVVFIQVSGSYLGSHSISILPPMGKNFNASGSLSAWI